MALLMQEKGVPIHSVVAFDTGWEFPQMYEHWDLFEQVTGLKIIKLHPKQPFDYWLAEHVVRKRSGPEKGQISNIGYGWPSSMRRWCTREKVRAINSYLKTVPFAISCVGMAADEAHRTRSDNKYPCRYPLIEWGVDEFEALAICKLHGFHWGGLYDVFRRVSCFCCPLARMGELRLLRTNFPELWGKMKDMDSRVGVSGFKRRFKNEYSLEEIDNRFAKEEETQWMF